jgi:hypothetical protein
VTGPLAFLVAGVIDVLAFVIASLWFRTGRALRARLSGAGASRGGTAAG